MSERVLKIIPTDREYIPNAGQQAKAVALFREMVRFGEIEARIYDVTTTDSFDIGTEWHAARNNPVTTYTANSDARDIDIDNVAKTRTDTTALDTTKTAITTWQDIAAGSATSTYAYRKSKPFVGGEFDADTAGTIRFALLDYVNAEITLNILRTKVGAKLLANPRILVLDNETAEFEIISEIPYTEQSSTSEGGAMTSIKFKEVGVKLSVTPHVTRDGMVRLHIVPEFGVVTEEGTLVGAVQTVPTIDTRKINTKALVQDGQTVVIGGLRKREVAQNITKLPLLGDIPILGKAFFMDTEESVDTTELIIFITPRIIINPILTPDEAKGYKATNFPPPKDTYTEDEKAEMAEKNKTGAE